MCADQEEQNECEEENDETCDGCMEVFNEDDLSCLCSNENCGLFQKNCCKDCCAKNKCEDCVEEDSDEVKQYKAVLAETLRYEAIMDMMKK